VPRLDGPDRETSDLRGLIQQAIRANGPISFARFMELALYCPNSGYYERPDATPGRQGDFYTSASIGPVFGQLLAWQFANWLGDLPVSGRQITEAGAQDGRLAADLLGWLKAARPEFYASLEYWLIEPSTTRRAVQKSTLRQFEERVRWFEDWSAIPATGIQGVIFSNELLDALPVHRLGWEAANRTWFEWGVALDGDEFAWTKMATKLAPQIPQALLDVLPDGFTTEVCPAATDWWRSAARSLARGKLLTCDYGLTAEAFFTPERKNGTSRAYYRHHLVDDLLARPGEQDITAHVNFSTIQLEGENAGLRTEAIQRQGLFLTGILERALGESSFTGWSSGHRRQFQTLTHPEHLGRAFQVLVQSR
jgi:SAM-dependent MidA family methyltransferase